MTGVLAIALWAATAAAPQAHHGHHDHQSHLDHGAHQPDSPHGEHAGGDGHVHGGHGDAPHPSVTAPGSAPEGVTSPPAPSDHAADMLFDPQAMDRARAVLRRENGDVRAAMILIDQLEWQTGKGRDGYRWKGEAWSGGDLDRIMLKSEGEGRIGGALERAELQLLYARAIDPWFTLQAGLRQDIRPRAARTYIAMGVEGLAPYWVEVEAALFLSDRGELTGRMEVSHDIRLTGRLVLTPRGEVALSAQSARLAGIGAGVTGVELGARLHYLITPRIAPYAGVSWERAIGATARLVRAAGDHAGRPMAVMGLRIWF
ncbi:MAG: copper resistance protein B [Sphingobium sp.]